MSNDITLKRDAASSHDGYGLSGGVGDKRQWDAENKLVEC